MRLLLGRSRPRRPSRQSWAATACRLRGPLFAAVGAGSAYQGGFGQSGSGRHATVSASVAHAGPWGHLDVDTSDEPPWGDGEFEDYQLASDWLHRALRPGRTVFPISLTADRWHRDVDVDGVPVPFVFVGGGTTWCAAGTVGGRQVRVGAAGWPHERLALVTVQPGQVCRRTFPSARDDGPEDRAGA